MRVQRKNNKTFIISAVAVAIATASYATVSYSQSWWPFESSTTDNVTPEIREVNSVDYSGPTEEEIVRSQDGKKNSAETNATQSNKNSGKKQLNSVSVGVSFADIVGQNLEIRAFTPNTIEGDGKCTATLTLDGLSVSETVKSFIDSRSTQCDPMVIAASKLPKEGEWSIVVSYESSTSTGESEVIKVKVP